MSSVPTATRNCHSRLELSGASLLLQIPGYIGGTARYSVTRDGKRFLLPVNTALTDSPITVVLNWTAKLKK